MKRQTLHASRITRPAEHRIERRRCQIKSLWLHCPQFHRTGRQGHIARQSVFPHPQPSHSTIHIFRLQRAYFASTHLNRKQESYSDALLLCLRDDTGRLVIPTKSDTNLFDLFGANKAITGWLSLWPRDVGRRAGRYLFPLFASDGEYVRRFISRVTAPPWTDISRSSRQVAIWVASKSYIMMEPSGISAKNARRNASQRWPRFNLDTSSSYLRKASAQVFVLTTVFLPPALIPCSASQAKAAAFVSNVPLKRAPATITLWRHTLPFFGKW
ncbi:hypothetical protein [Janthinobacterium lividum]|uniref:hypothetical protein n=1 Tax=Janthinobacterium lividum TaxID=29581 RepID=UPI00147F3808|nr:hypothetical protein [Janthinobacterium lividum]